MGDKKFLPKSPFLQFNGDFQSQSSLS